jgi:hypothetical protein
MDFLHYEQVIMMITYTYGTLTMTTIIILWYPTYSKTQPFSDEQGADITSRSSYF